MLNFYHGSYYGVVIKNKQSELEVVLDNIHYCIDNCNCRYNKSFINYHSLLSSFSYLYFYDKWQVKLRYLPNNVLQRGKQI